MVVSKDIRKWCISRYSNVVHKMKLPFAYSEFTVHMQNQLEAGSFVGTKVRFSHGVPFLSLMHVLGNERCFR